MKGWCKLNIRELCEDAAQLLRDHGINAYEQGGQPDVGLIVIYAATTSAWRTVETFPISHSEENPISSPQDVVDIVVAGLQDMCSGPHSH